jgi:predicted TIM-barrel fold metal-dependent hydrolase
VFPDSWIRPFFEASRERVPGVEFFDAHTHFGHNDPDGFKLTSEQLLAGLDALPGRAAVFPMHEPGGYSEPNDRAIEEAARSDGRLVAFCRLNPADRPVEEARRCLEAGAVGIKLHPRAEAFELATPELSEVFAIADERHLPVLVHAGRGIPALGRHAVELCERHPGLRLILAHAGICDLAWIWQAAGELPNLFFDTSWWSADDLLALFTLVPPGQILFGSDTPYGTPTFGAAAMLRFSLQAGFTEEQVRSVAGGQMARLVAGEEPLDQGPPVGPGGLPNDALLNRVYTFLVSAVGQMFNGVEPTETLALAELACDVPEGSPQEPVCRAVRSLLALQPEFSQAAASARAAQVPPEEEGTRFNAIVPGVPVVIAASDLCRTPDVPLPQEEISFASTSLGSP